MIKKFIFGIILLICISSIYANSPPELPAIYYGTIESPQTINGVLVAKIDNNVVGSIPIKNNVFGNESSKLLIYSPENSNKTILFYLNGNIKLDGSTTYNSGDVRKLTLYYNVYDTKSGSSSRPTTKEDTKEDTKEYNGVAKDIKSEKIKQFVYKAKLILGSNVDLDLSAKNLKDDSELIKLPTEIKEDCILVGGEVANPLVKKYQFAFKVKVTNNNPGKNKGVIQKQLINGHEVVLLAGSDRYGTKAAVEYFKTLEDIPDEPIFVKWENGKVVKIK